LGHEAPGDFAARVLVLGKTGEEDGGRRLCARLLEKYGTGENPAQAYATVRACVQLPDAVGDPDKLVAAAEKLAGAFRSAYEVQVVLGAALYRAGKYDRAAEQLARAAKLTPKYEATPEHRFYLAL